MKKGSSIFMQLIKVGLVFYTMLRTIDLVMSTLPESIKVFGSAVVFGLDVALLAWDNYAADPHKARSDSQHVLGLLMIVANLVGITATMIGDAARIVDPIGSRELIFFVSIYGIPIVVIGNLVGLIAVNQLDPDRVESAAQATHERQIVRMEKDHERAMALLDKKTELDIASFRDQKRVKEARKRYYIDDDGDGVPDRVVEKRGASPNGQRVATLAADSPMVKPSVEVVSDTPTAKIDILRANVGRDGHDYGPTFAQLQEMARVFPDSMAAFELQQMRERGETMTEADRFYADRAKSAAPAPKSNGRKPKAG